MKRANLIAALLTGLAMLLSAAATQAGPTAEAEARAAFARLVDISKQGRLDQFKGMVATADLREMEAMEREQPGLFTFMMEMIAMDDPAQFQAEIGPDRIVFVKRVTLKTGDGSSSETTKVTLIREKGQWKFGKPRP